MNRTRFALALIGALAMVFFVGCGDDDNPTDPGITVDQTDAVISAVNSYVTSGSSPVTKADVLFATLNDGDDANDPFVLSVRSADHYALGHIPGAANISWKEIADPAKLATLPTDRQIVVYCYTGHTGAVATTVLNSLGYDAINMKFGMCAWTKDLDVRVATAFSEATDAHDYAVETTINDPAASYDMPDLDVTGSTDTWEIARAAAEVYTAGADGPTKKASDVFDNLNDGDDANNWFIVSVRSAEHYAGGHIPGAINIPWTEIGDESLLKKIPADATVLVYCYTGHTGGIATTALRMMGYEAYNMKWGMVSWTTDPDVRATAAFSEEIDAHDYAVESGN